MLDLTKIEKPFGLLDEDTRKALMAHHEGGGKIEFYQGPKWVVRHDPVWSEPSTYRAKPGPRVVKAKYSVGKVYSSGYVPTIAQSNFSGELWRKMTGEVVVGDDGWPVSITLTRETRNDLPYQDRKAVFPARQGNAERS